MRIIWTIATYYLDYSDSENSNLLDDAVGSVRQIFLHSFDFFKYETYPLPVGTVSSFPLTAFLMYFFTVYYFDKTKNVSMLWQALHSLPASKAQPPLGGSRSRPPWWSSHRIWLMAQPRPHVFLPAAVQAVIWQLMTAAQLSRHAPCFLSPGCEPNLCKHILVMLCFIWSVYGAHSTQRVKAILTKQNFWLLTIIRLFFGSKQSTICS